jgi:hypothetical protein
MKFIKIIKKRRTDQGKQKVERREKAMVTYKRKRAENEKLKRKCSEGY